jgi:hypothetical protein
MKKIHWISAIALTAGLVVSFGLGGQQPSTGGNSPKPPASTASPMASPVRYPLRVLRVAAEPLRYLPIMQDALAVTYPQIHTDGDSLTEAEVRLTRVGPLKIGMTLEEAADALQVPLVPLGSSFGGECAYYQPDLKTQAMGLMVVDRRVIRVDVWLGSTLKTVNGIGVGSTEAEVLEAYPKQIESSPNPYTEGKFLTYIPEDPGVQLYRLVFETDAAGKVVQYRTGQFPAVTWLDGCV